MYITIVLIVDMNFLTFPMTYFNIFFTIEILKQITNIFSHLFFNIQYETNQEKNQTLKTNTGSDTYHMYLHIHQKNYAQRKNNYRTRRKHKQDFEST